VRGFSGGRERIALFRVEFEGGRADLSMGPADDVCLSRFECDYPVELRREDCVAFLESFAYKDAGRVLVSDAELFANMGSFGKIECKRGNAICN
jgi:hypothetical protein